MKLTPQELIKIQLREQANALKREKWRKALEKEKALPRYEPLAVPLNHTQVELDGATLRFNGRYVALRWGKLAVTFKSFDEAAITRAIQRLRDASHHWPDGTLRGIKKLVWTPEGYRSPTFAVPWTHGECHATVDPELILRGRAGIHAVWASELAELNQYPGRLVELAAWGVAVVGDVGWRAEHARIVRVLT